MAWTNPITWPGAGYVPDADIMNQQVKDNYLYLYERSRGNSLGHSYLNRWSTTSTSLQTVLTITAIAPGGGSFAAFIFGSFNVSNPSATGRFQFAYEIGSDSGSRLFAARRGSGVEDDHSQARMFTAYFPQFSSTTVDTEATFRLRAEKFGEGFLELFDVTLDVRQLGFTYR